MRKMEDLIALDDIIREHTFWISLNANDTFYYACADAVDCPVSQYKDLKDPRENIDILIEAYKKWGNEGILAFMAETRMQEPIGKNTKEYKEAREWLAKQPVEREEGRNPSQEVITIARLETENKNLRQQIREMGKEKSVDKKEEKS